jgi:hypothetical protein
LEIKAAVIVLGCSRLKPCSRRVRRNDARSGYSRGMSRQALGNALAGVLFLIIAIVDFTRDDSGIGVVFLVFAAVFLGLAFSGRKQ